MRDSDEGDQIVDVFARGEEEDPDCQISGCDRPGEVPRKMAEKSSEDQVDQHYVCRFHHRLFLGIKLAAIVLVTAIFFVAFFTI